MAINWSLLQPVDVGGMAARGFEEGRQMRDKYELKSALATYSQNPGDPQAQSALARVSPEFAMKLGEHQWKLQAEEAERRRRAALLSDMGAVPEGLNGKPATINWRQRQTAALMAGDDEVARAAGSMADDQERAAELARKKSVVHSQFNPITGALTYFDADGNPIGDDQHPYVRYGDEVHAHGWTPPAPATDAVAAPPDQLAPAPAPQATPSGNPTDPSLAKAPPPFDLFGPLPPNAQPGENMETYLIRMANEAIAAGQDEAETRARLVEMVTAYRAGRQ